MPASHPATPADPARPAVIAGMKRTLDTDTATALSASDATVRLTETKRTLDTATSTATATALASRMRLAATEAISKLDPAALALNAGAIVPFLSHPVPDVRLVVIRANSTRRRCLWTHGTCSRTTPVP
jgi:hypothetical protein